MQISNRMKSRNPARTAAPPRHLRVTKCALKKHISRFRGALVGAAVRAGFLSARPRAEGGWFLVSTVVMILFLTGVGLAIAGLIAEQYQHTVREEYTQNAELVAEAGIEQSVNSLNSDSSFSGYSTSQTFFNNAAQGKGTFTTTVSSAGSGNAKTILSTGTLYRPNSTTPYITRKVKVIVVGTTSTGYSVLTGPGGLILGGSANITNSNVYVSGTIAMTGAAKIGTYSNPVTVYAANQACPTGASPGPTYAQVCTGGSQPISMAFSTNIYGSVCATGQTSTGPNNNIQGGNGGAGLESGCTAPIATMTAYDRQAQINAVTTTASGSSGAYVCSGNKSITWPANLKLTGDVTIGNSCKLTIMGNVYITGNLTANGASITTVSNTVGSTRPNVIVDGTITVGGSAAMAANSSGTGIQFISFKSAASCSPSCTTVNGSGQYNAMTGNDLYNSQKLQTISVGGAVNLPGMIFNAYWSEVSLSGSGILGAATGQTVNLSGAGSVVFGTSLSSGSETWSITSYQPVF